MEERGGRGEEAGRAATQLSDIREEAPDTRARQQESRITIFFPPVCFGLFPS